VLPGTTPPPAEVARSRLSSEAAPLRLRLRLAYDGTDFAGWAEQPGERTVAGVLRPALELLARGPVRLVVAGRTDAGVHAAAQVVHVDVPTADRISRRALDGLLPRDVRVHAVEPAPQGFDARFAATRRRYAYRVTDGLVDPLRRRDTLSWPRPLDEAAMTEAATLLLGLRDFAAFCRRRERSTTTRELQQLSWARTDVLTATVVADAFCHSMVRSLIGALLEVGDGRAPVDWPAGMLARTTRADDVQVAPAHGLTLVEISYPPDDQLATRAQLTRARRAADR
jgi:tRNA pseudouridine38-40 synthase